MKRAPERLRGPRRTGASLLVILALFAVLGLWSAGTRAGPADPQERVEAVVTGLRCPTCAGESVAHSSAPIAEAMRAVAQDQVAAGRSTAEIRQWFSDRYGDEVLLDPPRRGTGWWLWSVPVLLVAAATAWLLRQQASRPRGAPVLAALAAAGLLVGSWAVVVRDTPAAPAASAAASQAGRSAPLETESSDVPVLRDAVAARPADIGLRLVLAGALEEQDRQGEAVEHYAAAVRLRPLDPDVRYRHAFALARSGSLAAAREQLQESRRIEPDHPPTLLLLGTLLHEAGDPDGLQVLRRFVQVAPEHPSAADVQQLLSEAAGGAEGTL